MADDDLRFGDIDGGSSSGGGDIVELGTRILIGLVFLYVILVFLESLFGIPIPFV